MTFRTFTVYLYSFFIMTGSIILLPFVYFFRLIKWNKAADYITVKLTTAWSRGSLYFAGVKHRLYGKENIPEHNNICIISNHQSYFDIPIILGNIPKVIGFISKKELSRIPLLNLWMYVIRCPFIDRNDRDKSLEVINNRLAQTAQGQPMLLFPEGTRSKSQKMNMFKRGGLLTVIEADPTILPITLCNTHKIYEASGHKVTGTVSKIIVHKAFKPSETGLATEEIINKLEETINPFNQKVNCEEM